MSRIRLFLLVIFAGLVPALVLIPTTSNAAASTAVSKMRVNPTAPIVGEILRVRGAMRSKLARPVVLQRLSAGKWVKVARKRTTRHGAFAFKARAATTVGTMKFRVSAPAATVGGVRRGAVVGPVRSVRGVAQTATLTVSPSAQVGTPYAVAASFTPARAGRAVALQKLVAGVWTNVDSGVESGSGSVTFPVTPDAGGTSSYRAVAAARNGAAAVSTSAKDVLVQVPPTITMNLADAFVGESYAQTLTTDDDRPGTWAIADGALPAGLVFSASRGTITGTPEGPRVSKVLTFSFTDEDQLTVTRAMRLNVWAKPTVATTVLPLAVIGESYDQTLATTDGRTGTWKVSAGALPAGLTLNPSTGAITGVATGQAVGSVVVSKLAVTFTDTDGFSAPSAIYLPVRQRPSITTATLANAVAGMTYGRTLVTADARPGTWAVTAGVLPVGLSLNPYSGALTGVPIGPAETSRFTVTFTDSDNLSTTVDLELKVLTSPTITSTELASGVIDQEYVEQLTLADSRAGTWAIVSSNLPDGLILDELTGAITGTPSGPAQTAIVTVKFTDNDGLSTKVDLPLTIDYVAWRMQTSDFGTTCGIGIDDSGWCWGANEYGQVGNGTTSDAPVPVRLPGAWKTLVTQTGTTCGIRTDNSGWCWGYNGWGAVGNGTYALAVASPQQLSPGSEWMSLDPQEMGFCGTQNDGTRWCWGIDYGPSPSQMW